MVAAPNNGVRVNLLSNDEAFIMVSSRKKTAINYEWMVQQSDYLIEWSGEKVARELSVQEYKSRNLYRWLVAALFPRLAKWQMKSISNQNPNLTKKKLYSKI